MNRESLSQFGPAAAVRIHSLGEEYQPPANLLSDLSPEQALEVPPGSPYSIADVLAHVVFWQELWLALIEGREGPRPAEGKNADWPRVTPEEWGPLFEQFVSGQELAWSLAETGEAELSRLLESGFTVGEQILRLTQHNNYHFGQVALLRQMLGLWPTAAGDDAWEESLHA
ncbi:MAG TPA: DinB family protein [Armatimonadaceae bacterium]|nr:DinB family protein [Armatimonadaceae bacterium]